MTNKSTYHTINVDGIPVAVPNVVEHRTGFYVSYNNYDIGLLGSDTTAICLTESTMFFTLNGDHRKGFEGKSFEQCLDYLHEYADLQNKHSEPFPPQGVTLEQAVEFAKNYNKKLFANIYKSN